MELPIQKEWPEMGNGISEAHKELHQVRNQIFHIGDQLPSSVSKANSGAVLGRRELEDRCHFRAW